MAKILISCFFSALIIGLAQLERRIKDGEELSVHKRYVVYLTKAPVSHQKYDYWLCGGALVTPWFVVTSAACVEDVRHMYVVAGYNKYVKPEELNSDRCTKSKKKKVVFTCVPKNYDLDYARIEKWSFIDIAVVKVESAFSLTDESYKTDCTYIPTVIPINYEAKYQKPGTDALVMGWGHLNKWREVNDRTDYNQDKIRYAPTRIYDKDKCKEHYPEEMDKTIYKYMVCTYAAGNLNDKGEIIKKSKPIADGCVYEKVLSDGEEYIQCMKAEDDQVIEGDEESRRRLSNSTVSFDTRRNGICQNDHGGPLVTWVGSREVLIGVASVFRVTESFECEGPYLFTSTQCNGEFLDCVINEASDSRTGGRRQCSLPPKDRGFDIVERKISWIGHPDGPAENERIERIKLRPQIAMDRIG